MNKMNLSSTENLLLRIMIIYILLHELSFNGTVL